MQDDKKRLKITDESLSPDEEHKIEVRVDKMMQFDKPAPAEPVAADESTVAAPETVTEVAESSAPVEESVEPLVEAEASASEPLADIVPEDPAPAEPVAADESTVAAPETDELAQLAAEPTDDPTAEPSPTQPADELAAVERSSELDKQDAELAAAFASNQPSTHGNRLKQFFILWWNNRNARWASFAVLGLVIITAAILPASRTWALNLVGMRATATITILDATTQLPLKNVSVTIGSATTRTNAQGAASLSHVKLGSQTLVAQEVAFATLRKPVSIKLGSNLLGKLALSAAGDQYRLKIIDYATGKPVKTASAANEQSTAIADTKGLIILNLPNNTTNAAIDVTADGYATQTVKVAHGGDPVTTVQLVLSRQEVYFSKQSGKYDVYKSDIDGQHKKVILPGTGNETSDITLIPHPTAEEVALVDTRDSNRNSDGYLLQALTLLDVTTGAPTTIDHSERIVPVDWIGDRLVYVMAKAGASAANASRYQLMSYDYRTNQRLELDHANAFNDIVSTSGALYYATSNQYNGGTSQFIKINADGTNKTVLLNNEVWNILRKDYSNFYLNTGSDNYTYKLGDTKPLPTTDTYSGSSHLFIDSPDGKQALWVDQRDGKGTLLVRDVAKQTDTIVAQQDGITYPVRWLSSDTVIYRVKSAKETADYVIGLQSNTAKKITDVSDAAGRSLWYFY